MSTCDIVYVAALSAFSARAAVMSAVLDLRRSCASTYDVVAFGVSKLLISVLVYMLVAVNALHIVSP